MPDESADVDSAAMAEQVGPLPVAALDKWRRLRWRIEHPLLGTRSPTTNQMRAAMTAAVEKGELASFGGPWFAGLDESEVWVNTTQQFIDATDVRSLTSGEIDGRRQVREVIDFWKRNVDGFENAALLCTAARLSIRETRRVMGEHVLTAEDVIEARPAPDGIALGCWPIDVHRSKGEALSERDRQYRGHRPTPYRIPYRCLVPLKVDQLLVAGRCISTSREGMGSIRVMGTCMAIGEAAGTAAALAARRGIRPRDLDIEALQSALRRQGVMLG
jgi:hypothetical protein